MLTTSRKGVDMSRGYNLLVAVISDQCGQMYVHRGVGSIREFPEEAGDEVHTPRA